MSLILDAPVCFLNRRATLRAFFFVATFSNFVGPALTLYFSVLPPAVIGSVTRSIVTISAPFILFEFLVERLFVLLRRSSVDGRLTLPNGFVIVLV